MLDVGPRISALISPERIPATGGDSDTIHSLIFLVDRVDDLLRSRNEEPSLVIPWISSLSPTLPVLPALSRVSHRITYSRQSRFARQFLLCPGLKSDLKFRGREEEGSH